MGVAEQLFEAQKTASVVQILDGKAVAQDMWTYLFGESCALGGSTYDVLYAAYGYAAGVGFSRCAGEEVVGRSFVEMIIEEVLSDRFVVEKCPLLSALCLADDEGSARAVEVVQSKVGDFPGA